MKMRSMLLIGFALIAATAFAQYGRSGYSNNDRDGSRQVLRRGTTVRVRTDSEIPSRPSPNETFSASVSQDVVDRNGNVIIPRGARATLVARPDNDGRDSTLDLRSVHTRGWTYNMETEGSPEFSSEREGLGANGRTAKYVGGGAAIGAVLGAILGGGKGAAIGAAVGGAGGAGTEVMRGRGRSIPPETELTYRLAQNLEVRPYSWQRDDSDRDNYRDRYDNQRRDYYRPPDSNRPPDPYRPPNPPPPVL